MTNKCKVYIFAVVVALAIFMQHPYANLQAQANLRPPSVATSSATVVKWTAGTLNNGGHAVTVTAGTASVTTSKADCSAPAYASCNLVYANSSGTVAVTTTLATALATGNTLLAYVETSGSAITKLSFPNQASTPYMSGTPVVFCGTSTTCASPTTLQGFAVHVAAGSGVLSSASPSTVTISGISPAFTSSSTYVCNTTQTTTAANGLKITYITGSSFLVTGPNTVTDSFSYICAGY